MKNSKQTFSPIKELAAYVEEEWRRVNYDYGSFPEIAATALRNFKQINKINLETIGRWLAETKLLPQQLQPYAQNGAFGEPPVTLYWGDKFVIDTYVWHTLNTSVHDHAFRGAFCVIQGSTLHTEFEFESIAVDDVCGIKIGNLKRRKSELLQGPQHIVKILPSSELIHATSHLEDPTVTLCIRTVGESNVQQHTYYAPSLALSLEQTSKYSLQLAWLSSILQLKEIDLRYIKALVENSDPIPAILTILYYASSENDPKIIDELFLQFHRRFPRLTQALQNALDQALKFKGYDINQTGDKLTRLLCGLLLSCSDRHEVIEVIKSLFPDKNPETLFRAWLSRAQSLGMIPYQTKEADNETKTIATRKLRKVSS